jgi:hypothetical protein
MSHILVLAETWNYNELISDRKNSGNRRENCKQKPSKDRWDKARQPCREGAGPQHLVRS